LLDRPLIMMTYLFWIRSPKFSSSMAQTHPSKSEQKLLKLYSTSKIHFTRGSVKLHLLVSIYIHLLWYRELKYLYMTVCIFFLEDGRMMADAEAGEFWGFFGGFAPLPRRAPAEGNEKHEETAIKLLW